MNRTHYRTFFLAFCAACVFVLHVSSAQAASPQYNIIDLSTLGGTVSQGYSINSSGAVTGMSYLPGDSDSHVFLYDGTMHDLGVSGYGSDINNSGRIAGTGDLPAGHHAFFYDGTFHDLGTFGGPQSEGIGINSQGWVTGHSWVSFSSNRIFLYDGTTVHNLGTLGGSHGSGRAINDSGKITGASSISGNQATHAFLYDGTLHDLGTLGGTNSIGNDINSQGHIVGYADTSNSTNGRRAFFYDGTMHNLGTLGGLSEANGINDVGQIVGESSLDSSFTNRHAFIYDSINGMIDLNTLISPASGWTLTAANEINNNGWITGEGTINGQTHAFILVPIPEPGTISLFVLGGVGLLWRALRRRKFC